MFIFALELNTNENMKYKLFKINNFFSNNLISITDRLL